MLTLNVSSVSWFLIFSHPGPRPLLKMLTLVASAASYWPPAVAGPEQASSTDRHIRIAKTAAFYDFIFFSRSLLTDYFILFVPFCFSLQIRYRKMGDLWHNVFPPKAVFTEANVPDQSGKVCHPSCPLYSSN